MPTNTNSIRQNCPHISKLQKMSYKFRLSTSILKRNSYSQFVFQNRVHLSTKTAPLITSSKPWYNSMGSLYPIISAIDEHNVSVVPALGQWITQGRKVDKSCVQDFIKELRRYKRYSLALQVSTWMTDKSCLPLSRSDAAIRLDLISKVHGIELAENHFCKIPEHLRGLEVFSALLNCYAHVNSVEKAEAVIQKMRDMGLARTSLCYNVLLNLYHQTENYKKLDSLILEYEEKRIPMDNVTYGIWINAHAARLDIDGIDKIVERMESDCKVVRDWTTYSIAANAYTKAGLVGKALAMLKKSEGLILTSKRRKEAYEFLLTQYVAIGMKDDMLKLWDHYKRSEYVCNRGYMSIITSLLKFDDIGTAEEIYEEWELRNLTFDIRIPNYLIGAYSRKGLPEKAEALKGRIVLKGQKLNAWTWYYLATGYIQINEIGKAVEAMKEALSVYNPVWKPSKDALAACLQYLRGKGDLEGAVEFLTLLKDKDVVPPDIHDKLMKYVEDGKIETRYHLKTEESCAA